MSLPESDAHTCNGASPTFVVADAHGRLDLIEGLLAQEGLLDPEGGTRGGNATVVHLGDLCNCVVGSIEVDLACLRAAQDLFDVLLVGNHEHPYFGGPTFGGFWRDPEIATAIHRLDWQPSYAVDEFLITHAGFGPEWALAGAKDNNDLLRAAWRTDAARHPYFAQIGYQRGGDAMYGGILWADWSEPKSTAAMSQIVGHTPGPIRVQGEEGHAKLSYGRPRGLAADEPFALCIDLGSAKGSGDQIAGCWIRGDRIEVAIYSSVNAEAAA